MKLKKIKLNYKIAIEMEVNKKLPLIAEKSFEELFRKMLLERIKPMLIDGKVTIETETK